MKTIPTKQTNEKQTIIHTFEPEEKGFPFAILEEIETTEDGTTTSKFEPILGSNKLSEKKFETFNEVIDYIDSKPYELIIALVVSMFEAKEQFENEQIELLKHKQNEVQK